MENAVSQYVTLNGKKENIFGDNIAFVENWDFSKANLSEEHRLYAITQVASICYQSPKALGSESLYNRLMSESHGLPSSSFEFVPILLDPWKQEAKRIMGTDRSNARKFGEWITYINPTTGKEQEALLTNYRAIYYDYEQVCADALIAYANKPELLQKTLEIIKDDFLKFFNTEEECEIISKHFKVFRYNIDFPTRSQMVRHRVNWQELSRRYVSGKRVPFDFYISENMKNVTSINDITEYTGNYTTKEILDICLTHYYAALESGVKPQDARRIIPQAAYTTIWGAFQPSQLENYFRLREDDHAQWEIRQTAIAMKELLNAS